MDKILRGILRSNHSESLKQQLIERCVIPTATQSFQEASCVTLLEMTSNYVLYDQSEFVRKMALKVFISYAKNNLTSMNEFCTVKYFQEVLADQNVTDKQDALQILYNILTFIKNTPLSQELILSLENNILTVTKDCQNNLHGLKILVLMIKEFNVRVPQTERLKFYKIIIEAVSNFQQTSTDAAECIPFVGDITTICSVLKQMWSTSNKTELLECLKLLYAILCREEPYSVSIAGVAQVFPGHLISLSNSLIDNEILKYDCKLLMQVLARMIDWLNWPVATNAHSWILCFLTALQRAKLFVVIIKVTVAKIEQVADRLFIPIGRASTFNVFRFLLLSFQHSPLAFNKVLNRVENLVEVLKDDKKLMDSFIECIHCLNHLHAGAPELYKPLLESISSYETPRNERIEKLISNHRYDVKKPQCFPTKTSKVLKLSRQNKSRSETGYVGLENMGNTCYMNSIVQALFMTKSFLIEFMKKPYHPNGRLIGNLQHLFAFLTQSQRKYFTPLAFSERSKPPWFQSNHQQDCSEYLRYFLDILHEEELSEKKESLVQHMFFGKIQTDFKCLNCKIVSSNSDLLSDIGVAFPDSHNKQTKADYQETAEKIRTENAKPGQNSVTKPYFHLEELLDHYFKPEILEGNNSYECSNCGSLQNAVKSIKITDAPKNLILHLLRFSYCNKRNAWHKNCVNINYPKTLVLNSYNNGETIRNIYSLYAVIVHSGRSADCGHYYTYARHLSSRSACSVEDIVTGDEDLFVNEWYLFNDETVLLSSFDSFGNPNRQGPNETAYMLFYCSINSICDITEDSLKTIPIPNHLSDTISQDNKALQEEEQSESDKKRSKSSYMVSNISWRDNNGDDDPPPQGGSNCGSGNLNLSVSNFVF